MQNMADTIFFQAPNVTLLRYDLPGTSQTGGQTGHIVGLETTLSNIKFSSRIRLLRRQRKTLQKLKLSLYSPNRVWVQAGTVGWQLLPIIPCCRTTRI